MKSIARMFGHVASLAAAFAIASCGGSGNGSRSQAGGGVGDASAGGVAGAGGSGAVGRGGAGASGSGGFAAGGSAGGVGGGQGGNAMGGTAGGGTGGSPSGGSLGGLGGTGTGGLGGISGLGGANRTGGGVGTGGGTGTGGGSATFDKPIDHDTAYPDGTEVSYLSGTGTDDAVNWNFTVSGGRRAGVASTIPVPSNWEFFGFGSFNYGTDGTRSSEQGTYSRSFDVPATWAGRQIFIAFEGSMTDTTVTINGKSAGPVHQGAFYRFRYDITSLVNVGATNQIQVVVAKESSDSTVNDAERSADYWVFGGIFRPVYLEGYPKASVERMAVNAGANGSLAVDVYLRSLTEAGQVTARLFDDSLTAVGSPITVAATANQTKVTLAGTFAGIKQWTAETPNRYRLAVELATTSGVHHAVRENIGFRTIEVKAGTGIYVNGTRVMLKGLTRHCFWPESGRALSRKQSLDDVQLLKSMNVNAVRNSHYPADRHFFEYADALGLYVLDELAGWQKPPYGTTVGRKLIEEMVTFDVNHPSILFWDNGNEGGWNTALDGDFALWDPQKRSVLHPQQTFSNINDAHYPTYSAVVSALAGTTLFMPTEFLHGLYDGGGGAGLEDYWTAMRASPRGAGGFIWAFLDEGVLRADVNNTIDTKGNQAPDGVVGPYRQKEGSYYTIRQVWSPVRIAMAKLAASFTGAIPVSNDYAFLNLNTVQFKWQLVQFDVRATSGGHTVMAEGTVQTGSIAAGASGTLTLPLPANWSTAHALLLDATDSAGTLIGRWSWGITSPTQMRATIVSTTSTTAAAATSAATTISVAAGGANYTFNKASGQLSAVTSNGAKFSLSNGPALSSGTGTIQSFTGSQDGNDYVIVGTYTGSLQQVLWRVMGNGWLGLTYRYALSGNYDHHGVTFTYPEAQVTGADWLGRGPARVYKNRMQGPWLDLWQREKNNAITGQVWDYPEFKGNYSEIYWARLRTSEGPILFVVDTPDVFLRLYTPANASSPMTATTVYPTGDISFLQAISPMGNKFSAASGTGPQGGQNAVNGTFEGTIYMRFGDSLP
jgi:beta-galactosidase/beta-glucuronidase